MHELGHRFDNQAKSGLSGALDMMASAQLDCTRANPVFGPVGREWSRGTSGWGDNQSYAGFQQNPTDSPGKSLVEIQEAAGDMFLNWVYRRITDGLSGSPCSIPASGRWLGFKNITANGFVDVKGLPGDIRYEWMEYLVTSLFSQNKW